MKKDSPMQSIVFLSIGMVSLAFSIFSWSDHIWIAPWIGAIFLLRFIRQRKEIWAILLGFLALQVAFYIGLIPIFAKMDEGTEGGMVKSVMIRYFIIWQFLPGIFYLIPFLLDRLFYKKLPCFAASLIFPLSVVTIEWIQSFFFGNLFTFSQTQYSIRPLVYISSFLGFYGVTFLVTWGASVVNALWEYKWNVGKLGKMGILYISLFLGLSTISGILIAFPQKPKSTVMLAGITIKDHFMDRIFSTHFNYGGATGLKLEEYTPALSSPPSHLVEIRKKTEEAIAAGAEIIVWQEYALVMESSIADGYLDEIRQLADREDVYILASYARILKEEEIEEDIIRNLGVLFTPQGEIGWTYDKSYPVYGSEDAFSGKGPGELPYYDTEFGRIGQAICYDMHFSQLLRQADEKGIDLLLGPSNDGHVCVPTDTYNNAFRAVEYGFTIVRITEGLSAVHDPYYRQWAGYHTLDQGNRNFYAHVPVISYRTFYSRIGFLFPYLVFLGLLFLLLYPWLKRKFPRSIP